MTDLALGMKGGGTGDLLDFFFPHGTPAFGYYRTKNPLACQGTQCIWGM